MHSLSRTQARDERGVVMILVALSLVALMAMTALVIDIGYNRQRKRASQNSSDAIALAAVQDLPTGDWMAGGTEYAGYNSVGLVTLERGTWNASSSTFTPDADQSSPGPEDGGNCVYAATAEDNDTTGFANFVDDNSVRVSSKAVACEIDQRTDAVAIFGNSLTCQNNLQFNFDGLINGGMHTNNDLFISGGGSDGPTIIGDATYVTDFNNSNATFDPADDNPREVEVKDIPVVIPQADYAPGGSRALAAGANYYSTTAEIDNGWLQANGHLGGEVMSSGLASLDDPAGVTLTDDTPARQADPFTGALVGLEIENVTKGETSFVNAVTSGTSLTMNPAISAWDIGDEYQIRTADGIQPGLYYTTGDVKLTNIGSGIDAFGVTFVAGGEIDISTNGIHITPWDDPAPVLSSPLNPVLISYENYSGGQKCSKPVIDLSASDSTWQGLIYAPEGLVNMSGASNVSIEGSIIADSIQVSGANFQLTYPEGPDDFLRKFVLMD